MRPGPIRGMPTFAGVLSEEAAQAIRAYVIRQRRQGTGSAAE